MKFYFVLSLFIFSLSWAREDIKTIYKYKKYEKFDFDELKIDGEVGTPGDLSILHRFQQRYKNRLPYRKNFNAEIRKAVKRIR